MLQLIVPDDKSLPQDATLCVRWCVDPNVIGDLKSRGVTKPYILFVVVPEIDSSETKDDVADRFLVPFDQVMTYVQFRRPGRNTILASIVWDPEGKHKRLKDRLLRKDRGAYKTRVLSFDGQLYDDYSYESAELDVVVPADRFAKERPAWEKAWVNYPYSAGCCDQCAYRKRAALSILLTPGYVALIFAAVSVYVLVTYAVRLAIAGYWISLAARGLNWAPFKVWACEVDDWTWNNEEISQNARLPKLQFRGPSGKALRIIPFTLLPIVQIPAFGAIFLGVMIFAPMEIWRAVMYALTLSLLVGFVSVAVQYMWKRIEAAPVKRKETVVSTLHFRYDDPSLTCRAGDLRASIDALPRSKKTIYLRFLELKKSVCRPYAR